MKILSAVTVFFVLFSAHSVFCDDSSGNISNFRKVDDGLYRGASPGEKGLEYLKGIGVKTIIDLRGGKASVRKEARLAEKLGIRYINIPSGEIKNFLKIAADPQNRPVFVHCHNGIHRTGRMIKAYHENKN